MADTNNQRAQKFDSSWSAANAQAVVLKGSNPKETALLENIRSLVVAAIQDIYGTSDDPKYIYIVDLILKRIKKTLADLNISSDLETIKSELSEITKNLKSDEVEESIGKVFSEVKSSVEKQFAKYFEQQKAEFEELKSSISELTESVKTSSTEEAEPTEAAEPLDSSVVQQISEIAESVTQLETTIQLFAETIAVKFSEIQTTIDTRFSEITTTLTTIDKNLADSMTSTSKSFDDMSLKIEKSNKAILNAISQIQSSHNSSAIGAMGSSIINGIANITTGLFSSISSVLTGITGGIASAVTASIKSNEILAKLDKIDATTVKNVEIASKTLALTEVKSISPSGKKVSRKPSLFSNKPKVFAKIVAKYLNEYQKKTKSAAEQRVEDLEWSISGMFKHYQQSISRAFTGLNRYLKKGFKGITKSIRGLGSKIKGMIGSTVSGISTVFQLILSPLGFMVSGLFKMVSFIFKPLSWLLNLFKSPAFFLLIGAAFLLFWPKIKDPILNWYNKYMAPAIDKIKEIFMGDMPFFDKIKESLKVLWDAIWAPFGGFDGFMRSLNEKLKTFAKTVLWPFVKNKVWPYMKSHWKEILIGIAGVGILSFLKNPMSVVSLALKAPTAILNTIKVAQIAAKGVALVIRGMIIGIQAFNAALPAIIAAAPLVLPALIVTAILGCVLASWIQDLRAAEKELEETAKKGFDDAKIRGEQADANIKKNLEIVSQLREDNKELFKKFDIQTADDLIPEEITTADGRVTTAEFLQENIDKVANITRNSTFDEAWQKVNSKDLELDARGKEGIFARGFSKINAQLDAAFKFANTFAADKLNHIGDTTLLKRHKVFVDMFNKERQAIGKELEFYNKEISETWSDGSDEDWEKKFDSLQERIVQWTKNALNYLTTNPDKAVGPTLNFSKVDDQGNVIAMTAAEQAAELKRYEAELAKASKEERKAANKRKDKANWIARSIESRAIEAVNSHDLERVHEMSNNNELMYQQTIQDVRDGTTSHATEQMEKMMKSMNFAMNDTQEDRQTREMVTQLIKQQSLLNYQQTGDSRVSEEQQLKILAAAREKIEALAADDKNMTAAQRKRYQKQLEALKQNEEMSKKLDTLIKGQKTQTEEMKKLETGTTNNYTAVGISGGQVTGQQNKENARR